MFHSNKCSLPDPGRPIDEVDLWNARQLGIRQINDTTMRLMKLPQWRDGGDGQSMEELELIGERVVKETNNAKVALAHVRLVSEYDNLI